MTTRTTMPILGNYPIKEFPWEMIAPHAKQAMANHGQTLERLAQRGGLAPIEALAIIEGRGYSELKVCPENDALFFRRVEAFKKAQAAPITVTAWHIETDPLRCRRFGKLLEELGELTAVVARCTIQGVDEIDPSSGKKNRDRLQDELADVMAQLELTVEQFKLNRDEIHARALRKKLSMAEWERLLREGGAA